MSIQIKNVSYIYDDGSLQKIKALDEITTIITKNKMTAIIGHAGCGKTTLMQHLNGLLLATQGEVVIDEFVLKQKMKQALKPLRMKVGLVFQFSENQLFEETVQKDIEFGPKNFNVDKDELQKRVLSAIKAVGLDESYLNRSCFHLSGGEKRRVAIAGVLAMNPEIIILDEPTAGLDPKSTQLMIQMLKKLQQDNQKTVIVVTHDHDLVYEYFDDVILLDKGKLITKTNAKTIFDEYPSLQIPKLLLLKQLFEKNNVYISKHADTVETILKEVIR